jgi:hypothetical protein
VPKTTPASLHRSEPLFPRGGSRQEAVSATAARALSGNLRRQAYATNSAQLRASRRAFTQSKERIDVLCLQDSFLQDDLPARQLEQTF